MWIVPGSPVSERSMNSHHVLAKLCQESYQTSDFEEAGIEVMVSGNCFVFRGTDEARDVIRDIRVLPLWTSVGWCPAGFFKASRRLLPKIMSWCLEHDIDHKKIELTGHSLGGAVAQLVGALMVRDEIIPAQVVTFGAPKCGRLKLLDQVPKVFLYRNGKDIVSVIPFFMRRHKPLVRVGKKCSSIKDHFIKNYVRAKKLAGHAQ